MGIEAEFIVKCDGCGITATDDYADEVYKWGEREAAEACEVPRWRRIAGKCYCPKCRLKLALPHRWQTKSAPAPMRHPDDLAIDEILPADGGTPILSIVHTTSLRPDYICVRKDLLPVLLAANVSAAAVEILLAALEAPADVNRAEAIAIGREAMKAIKGDQT